VPFSHPHCPDAAARARLHRAAAIDQRGRSHKGPATPRDGRRASPSPRTYLAMWGAYVTASSTANYQSPVIARYAAGAALSLLTNGLYANHQDGIVTKGKPSFSPSVTIPPAAEGVAAFSSVPQVAIADCGRLDPGSPALRLASHADAVVLIARPYVSDLIHLAQRLDALTRTCRRVGLLLGPPSRNVPAGGAYPAAEIEGTLGRRVLGSLPSDPPGSRS
jgi:hypothetical protein